MAPSEAIEGENLRLEAIYSGDPEDIANAKILYRLTGQIGYLEVFMMPGELKLQGEIPGETVGAPGIEYVIVVNLKDGGILAYPQVDDPLTHPVFIPVREISEKTTDHKEELHAEQVIILTPDPGAVIPFGDPMIIAVSLFNLENVDINSVRIFLDNVDVSAYSLITTDLVTYKPDMLNAGKHNIFVEISNIYGVRLASTSWNFAVESQAQKIFNMTVHGNMNVGHRTDIIHVSTSSVDSIIGQDTISVPIYSPITEQVTRLDFSTEANFEWAKVKVFANLTSKEDSTLQSQNRYGLKVRSSWLRYTLGDETPMMNRLALWGKRVRGNYLDLRLKWFNLQVVSGKTARAITGTASLDTSSGQWNRTGYSFERGLFGIRPSIGSGKIGQWGVFYVHVRDSVNSVKVRPPWWDGSILSYEIVDSTGTTTIPFGTDQYVYNGDTTDVSYFLTGSDPQDNVVLGTDLKLVFDDHRIVIQGSAAFSLFNRNIIDGPLTRSRLDTFSLLQDTTFDDTIGSGTIDYPISSLDEMLSGMGFNFLLTDGEFDPDKMKGFFVLNENLSLPVDIENLQEGNYLVALTSLALHLSTRLNYYGHFIGIDYHHIGPNYKAFGSPVLRTDQKGWNGWKITDKIRMLNNMLYLNVGWESYKNNTTSMDDLTDPRLATTALSGGITLNPGRGMPTVSSSFKFYTRDNNDNEIDTLGTQLIDNRELNETLTSNLNLSYIVDIGKTTNTIAISAMQSSTENKVTGFEGKVRGANLFGLNLRSEWGIPLNTNLSIRSNTSQLYEESDPNYRASTSYTGRISAGYRMLNDNLDLRLGLQMMSFIVDSKEGDILVSEEKTQSNVEVNLNYDIKTITFGDTKIKSRLIGGFEQRRYTGENYNYNDYLFSLRYNMVF